MRAYQGGLDESEASFFPRVQALIKTVVVKGQAINGGLGDLPRAAGFSVNHDRLRFLSRPGFRCQRTRGPRGGGSVKLLDSGIEDQDNHG